MIGRSVSSKPFCCSWAAIRSVWLLHTHTHTDTHRWLTPCGADRTTGERNSVCQGSDVSSGSAVRSRMAPDVCPVLQVELLIENEAEKDYLYDVLRMYHQWVPPVAARCGCSVCVCEQVALSFWFSLCHAHSCMFTPLYYYMNKMLLNRRCPEKLLNQNW